MTSSTTLHSGWTLRAVDPDPASPAAGLPRQIAATVPGTVHTDLLAAGLIVDPYLDLNELTDSWIGHTRWAYSTRFELGELADRTEIVFEGLDTVATVLVNGHEVARTANQHRTYRIDLTGLVAAGSNQLEVVFDSAWAHAEDLQSRLGPLPNAYPTPFNFIRKMAANFGWDWGPQLVTAGIWKEVRLETWSTRLTATRVSATVDHTDGVVTVSTGVDSVTEGADALQLRLSVDGVVVEQTVAPAADGTVEITGRVPDAELWWPRGLGGQRQYDVIVELLRDGVVLDRWQRRVGFRTVELDTSADDSGSAFTFVINGTPVFIRGANWIPDDCFPSRLTRARYRERIEQAAEANLNLLRVWGGGIYERDEFYEICDELGMMTWQDFLFACAAYPEEAPFHDEVEAEARDNVLRLSSHPSLVLWNGCNENIWGWFDWDWQQTIGDRTWGLGFYTDLLPRVVAELSPTTPYWPGSPYSGSPTHSANDPAFGNVHIWDVWNQVDYSVYGDYRPRFVSEFGFQGPPTWSTLQSSIHDEPLTPESPGMLLHQKATDGNGKLARGMAPHLREPRDFEDWHYLTQLNQARAIEFGIEHFRSQRPHCMGTIVWQLNDCWPVTSWAAVDGYGRRKPLWHALRRVNAERLLTLQPGGQLVAVNDSASSWSVTGTARRIDASGAVRAQQDLSFTVDRLSSHTITLASSTFETDDPADDILVVHVDGVLVAARLYVEEKDYAGRAASVRVTSGEWHDGRQTVRIETDAVARGVSLFPDRLHPEAWADACDLTVLPGEPVTVTVWSPEPLDPAGLTTAPVVRWMNGLADAREGSVLAGRTAQG